MQVSYVLSVLVHQNLCFSNIVFLSETDGRAGVCMYRVLKKHQNFWIGEIKLVW